jgi:hypothetical protein
MKKFMAIYMASGADFERMIKRSTPEQRSKGMEAWMNDNKASILESGAPLGKTKRADAVAIQFLGRCSAKLLCSVALRVSHSISVNLAHASHFRRFSVSCTLATSSVAARLSVRMIERPARTPLMVQYHRSYLGASDSS